MTKRNDSRNSTSGSAKLARFINKKWSSKVLERSRAACGMNPRKIFSPSSAVDRNRDKVGEIRVAKNASLPTRRVDREEISRGIERG